MIPGITGTLFPSRFLAADIARDDVLTTAAASVDSHRRRLLAWWRRAETACGPATGLRTIFDLVATPLAALLGFRAHAAEFDARRVRAWLTTKRGAIVGLMVLPWSDAPSRAWSDLAALGRSIGADWCLLVAPPFLSVVDARGSASRRSVDFRLPDVLDAPGFVAFWALASAAAFDADERAPGVRLTRLDRLVTQAAQHQDRVRDDLQRGVIEALGSLAPVLDPRPRAVPQPSRFDEALTIVYRVLFLLFAESRGLVPRDDPVYAPAYGVTALCREAVARPHDQAGLWEGLAAITRLARRGCESRHLIVRPFNGRLFSRAAAPALESARRACRPTASMRRRDEAIGRALTALGTRAGGAGRESIDYADLGVEQLGAVYERVLDLDPAADTGESRGSDLQRRLPARQHSARRKETGTFYTPRALTEFLVRRTLAPLVRGASSARILSLRIVDPAMGSGAFLVAACRYLAGAYQLALVEEGRAPDADFDADERADIRRLVAERCLSGVDSNPVAVQLARLSMWLTTLARDKPLSFLDHRLRHGNSLIGTSPDDLWRLGASRAGSALPLFEAASLEAAVREVAAPLRRLRLDRDATVAAVHRKEALWTRLTGERSPLDAWRVASHLWCARWFWPGASGPGRPPSPNELRAALDAVLKGDRVLEQARVAEWTRAARDAAFARAFFHWPLEFADVFYDEQGRAGTAGGFDAVLGNPPWEVVRDDPALVAFIRDSGLYPSCGRGHVNLYQPFLDRALSLARPGGRVGLVLPWGAAVDEGAGPLRARLFERGTVDTIVGFDNGAGLFPIHRGVRFVAIIASPGGGAKDTRARFGVRTIADTESLPDVDEAGDRSAFPLRLTRETIRRLGGRALRIPDLRRPADLAWMDRIARRFPPLGSAEGWHAAFGRELNATDDRDHFRAHGLPVLEGKHIGPFAVDLESASARIPESVAHRLLPDGRFGRARLAYRDVSAAGNRRTLIAAVVPGNVVTTHTLFCLRGALPLEQQHFLCALFNSYVLNAVVRRLMGSHVTTSLVEGLPVPVWEGTNAQRRIARLAARLARHPGSVPTAIRLQVDVARAYEFTGEELHAILDANPGIPAEECEAILGTIRAT